MVAVVVVGIAAAAAVVEWPRPTFGESPEALASVSLPSFAGTITSVEVRSAQGGNVPVRSEGGLLQPSQQLAQGELLTVAITVARPQWIGWLVGRTTTSHFSVTTPIARVSNRWIEVSSGESPRVIFDQPIRVVKLGNAPQEVLGSSLSIVSVGVVAGGDDSAGQIDVEAAPRTWERLSAPIRVTWFQADPRPQLMPDPEATTADPTLGPEQSLTLTFSRPVQQVFGASLPRLVPKTAGSWQLTDSHTLTFRPAGGGYPVGGTVRVDLPARVSLSGRKLGTLVKSLRWQVKPASTLRLQQLFAALGYIPLVWQPSGSAVASSVAAQVAAAVSPPAGQFAWRYSTTPRELRALWHPGVVDQITLAAIMAFEDTHHMPADGHAGPVVWSVLIHDAIAGVQHPGGYTYVFVHSSVPQSLNLWHDGRVIITSPGNTGVPAAPTKLGTFQVFEHIPVGTMSGVNPDGTTYNDPGIRWISYFNHGEAIHSFNRSSFGTPQSLGCVELPLAAAAKVWPYTPIGTLVTIEK
jgi:hypothetical protein